MCGRYGLTVSKEELEERYEAKWSEGDFTGQEEIFPTADTVVLLPNRKLYRIKWGFTPNFAKRPLINARSETILEKKTFKEPFSKRRCLIPATYFFEWQKVESIEKKEKKRIQMKDLPIFSMAGICERYTNENGESQLTYSILTTEANKQMASIHDRMPVILEPEDEQFYLNLDNDPKEVQALLKPSSRKLEITHVG
ncbi:hypothetical protein GCM10008932_19930 [Alkalibacterium iburiense]|uniref:Abasic site processing protein n=1 Tax=Alkalibacterium iburiense TaxID=290589 RepID=A0ABP3HEX9_9LACT